MVAHAIQTIPMVFSIIRRDRAVVLDRLYLEIDVSHVHGCAFP
jgi:hypothetical protein